MHTSICSLAAVLAALALLPAVQADTACVTSAWSAATLVDTRSGAPRTARAAWPVAYAPAYSSGSAADHVVLRSVAYADTPAAVTNDLATFGAGAEGGCVLPLAAADERGLRLLHSAYDANGNQIGETLAADVTFAITGDGTGTARIDTRPDSLQLVADEARDAGAPVTIAFAYDSAWATNGVPDRLNLRWIRRIVTHRRRTVLSVATNDLLSAEAPAAGDLVWQLRPEIGGENEFVLSFADADGRVRETPLDAAYYLKQNVGTCVLMR